MFQGTDGRYLAQADKEVDSEHGVGHQGCTDDDLARGRTEVPLPGQARTRSTYLLTFYAFPYPMDAFLVDNFRQKLKIGSLF